MALYVALAATASAPAVQSMLGFVLLDGLVAWLVVGVLMCGSDVWTGLGAALVFARSTNAHRMFTVCLWADGIRGDADGVPRDIAWTAVRRVVETTTHMVLVLSAREAVVLPRRAFASDADFRDARVLIGAHAGSARWTGTRPGTGVTR